MSIPDYADVSLVNKS